MIFKEYVSLIKRLLSDKVSSSDVLDLLFRHIIDKYDVRDRYGEPYAFLEKGNVSRIINGERSIPKEISCHLGDDDILVSLSDYWQSTIINRIKKDTTFVYGELQSIMERDLSIQPSTKRIYTYLLHKKQINVLLASMFIESIRSIGKTSAKEDVANVNSRNATIILSGINEDNELSDEVKAIRFEEAVGIREIYKIDSIREHIKDIKGITNKEPDEGAKNQWELIRRQASINEERLKVPEPSRRIITDFVKEQDIELGESFYDLWDLRLFRPNAKVGHAPVRTGTDSEKRKYELIEKLVNEIKEYNKFTYLQKVYGDTFPIKLAVSNVGNIGDSQIRLGLYIPKEAMFTKEDLDKVDDRLMEVVRSYWRVNDLLTIKRTTDYMDYAESLGTYNELEEGIYSRPDSCWKDYVTNPMYVTSKKDDMYLELKFDRIMQNTAIALPKMILLKKKPEFIRYTIVSNNMPEKVDSVIKVV